MLQTQRTFCDYLDGVKAELTRASALGVFEELGKNIQSAEALKREIAEAELVVPVIGAFSAGKSTLINSFLGSELLPVNITPETALATELRYSDRERVEAIRKKRTKSCPLMQFALYWDCIKYRVLYSKNPNNET